jgi:error-prone DNA polymerase
LVNEPDPISVIRKQLAARRYLSSADLAKLPHGKRVRFAGLVRMRQRPETASGVTFVTLEDEHGMVNAVVWQRTAEKQRRELLESSLMAIDGRLERADGVQHLIVSRMKTTVACWRSCRQAVGTLGRWLQWRSSASG